MSGKISKVKRYAEMEFTGQVFAGRDVETVQIRVEGNTIEVLDKCGGDMGAWTTCHSISSADKRAIHIAALRPVA